MINELSGRPAGVSVCVCSSNDSSLRKNRFTLIQLSHRLTKPRPPCWATDYVPRPLPVLIGFMAFDFFPLWSRCQSALSSSVCVMRWDLFVVCKDRDILLRPFNQKIFGHLAPWQFIVETLLFVFLIKYSWVL